MHAHLESPSASNDCSTTTTTTHPPKHPLGWPKYGSFSLWAGDFQQRSLPLYDLEPALRMIASSPGAIESKNVPHNVSVGLRALFMKLIESPYDDGLKLPLTSRERDEMLLRISELQPDSFAAHLIPAHADEARVRGIVARLSDAQVSSFFYVNHTQYYCRGKRWTHATTRPLAPPRWNVVKAYPGCTRDSVRHCEASVRRLLANYITVEALVPLVLGYMDCRVPCEVWHRGYECQLDVVLESALQRLRASPVSVDVHGIPCVDPLLRVAWAFKYGFNYADIPGSGYKRKRAGDATEGAGGGADTDAGTGTGTGTSADTGAGTGASADTGADAGTNTSATTNTDAWMPTIPMMDNVARIARMLITCEPILDFRRIDYIRRKAFCISDWELWPEWPTRVWTTADYEYMLRPETQCWTLFERVNPPFRAVAGPTIVPALGHPISLRPDAPDYILHRRARALYIGGSGFRSMPEYLQTLYDCGDHGALRKYARRSLVPRVREYERAGAGVLQMPGLWWGTVSGEVFHCLVDAADMLPGAIGLLRGMRNHAVFKALVERMERMEYRKVDDELLVIGGSACST